MGKKLNTPHTNYFPGAFPAQIQKVIAHGHNAEGTFPEKTDVKNVTAAQFGPAGSMISTPNKIIKFFRLLFSHNTLPTKQYNKMLNIINEENGKPVQLISTPEKVQDFTSIGARLGIGLVYFKDAGFEWMHSGGNLGYESLYAYNPCNNIIVALTNNTRHKAQFTFMNVFNSIYKVLNELHIVEKQANEYRKTHTLPAYCKPTKVSDTREYRLP